MHCTLIISKQCHHCPLYIAPYNYKLVYLCVMIFKNLKESYDAVKEDKKRWTPRVTRVARNFGLDLRADSFLTCPVPPAFV